MKDVQSIGSMPHGFYVFRHLQFKQVSADLIHPLNNHEATLFQ